MQPHVSLRQLRPQLRQLIVKLSQIRKYWRFSSAEELGMSVVVPPILLGLDERHWNKNCRSRMLIWAKNGLRNMFNDMT